MSEESSLERQEKKRILKGRILPKLGGRELKERISGILRRRTRNFLGILGIIVIALVVFAVCRTLMRSRTFSGSSVVWENTEVAGGSASYESFGNNVVKITPDGISCIGSDGTVLWNSGYTMTNPSVYIRGDYGAVADIQAQTAVIFGQDGVLGTVNTTLSILNLSVSSHGVLALVLDDTDVNYITFYSNTGSELDIKVKTKLSGDGYPMDIDLSPEGTGLIASVVYLDQGTMQNQVVFYNFDVGKSESNRMVGYFTYGDTMFPQVAYLSDTVACAFGDDQVNLYSLKNESKPELIQSIPVEEEILSILTGEGRVGIITEGEESSRVLTVYNTSGSQIFSADIDFEYTHAEFADENTLIYSSTECLILGGRGSVRFQGALDGTIQKLIYSGGSTALVFGSSSMTKVKFS